MDIRGVSPSAIAMQSWTGTCVRHLARRVLRLLASRGATGRPLTGLVLQGSGLPSIGTYGHWLGQSPLSASFAGAWCCESCNKCYAFDTGRKPKPRRTDPPPAPGAGGKATVPFYDLRWYRGGVGVFSEYGCLSSVNRPGVRPAVSRHPAKRHSGT